MGCTFTELDLEISQSENWETHQRHIFMGAGKHENKHGCNPSEQEMAEKNQ